MLTSECENAWADLHHCNYHVYIYTRRFLHNKDHKNIEEHFFLSPITRPFFGDNVKRRVCCSYSKSRVMAHLFILVFVWVDALCSSQQFSCHVGTFSCLLGLNQY